MIGEILLFVAAFAIAYLIHLYTKLNNYWPDRNVYFLSTSLWSRILVRQPFHESDRQMYNSLKKAGVKFGGVLEFGTPILTIMDFDLLKTILVKDFDSFTDRRGFDLEQSDPLIHNVVANQKGQPWKDLRSVMSPAFSSGKIRRMHEILEKSAGKMVEFLSKECASSSQLNIQGAISRYAMDVISSVAFGFDSQIFEDSDSVFGVMGRKIQTTFSGFGLIKLLMVFTFPKLAILLGVRVLDPRAEEFFRHIIMSAIKQRERNGERRNDFLQLMIDSKNGNLKAEQEDFEIVENETVTSTSTSTHKKQQMTDELILSQALLFFLGGLDTVETPSLFAAYELALNPDVQEKLYAEIQTADEIDGGKLSYEIMMKLEYLDKVISEVLRKYPPGARTDRRCTQNYKIPNSDLVIEKGTILTIPIYGIHHDEAIYPDHDKFDPERFAPEEKAKRHQFSYIPFSAGPRHCIAMRFALVEVKTAIVHLVRHFKMCPSDKTAIPMKFSKSSFMKPEGNEIWLKLESRKLEIGNI